MQFSRTANVYTRVKPETKKQAEAILNQLGAPMSNAIGMFLKQVVFQRDISFDMKLPAAKPDAIGSMTKEQIDIELQKIIHSARSLESVPERNPLHKEKP